MEKDPRIFLKHIIENIDSIDLDLVWEITQKDLPELKNKISGIL